MKTANTIPLTHFKYFIVQDDHRNAVGIISENEESVSFCNLTLLPYLHEVTGKIAFRLGAYPETPIRFCANPEFRNNMQTGIMRGMVDITKDPLEVERVLQLSKSTQDTTALLNADSAVL